MRTVKYLLLGLTLLPLNFNRALAAPSWSVEMTVAEACCCNPVCPCLFESPPTRGHCHVNWLAEIKHGRYGKVRLDGLSMVAVEEMGKWRRYCISDKATPEQAEALATLVGQLPSFEVKEVRSVDRVPFTVHRSGGRIRFATPTSEDEIEPLKGRNGKPIQLLNLPLADFVAYWALKHKYHGTDLNFDYSGTHGGAYRVKASSHDSVKAKATQ